MAIPDYQSLMLPILEFAADGEEHTNRDAIETIARRLGIDPAEREQRLPSGQRLLDNRFGWAKTYLTKAKLLDIPRRSVFQITKRGLQVLSERPAQLSVAHLRRFPEMIEFLTATAAGAAPGPNAESQSEALAVAEKSPEELLEVAFVQVRATLASELLDRLKRASPDFFEKVVVDALVKMGYGGSRPDAARALGKSGDGGVDGVVKQDPLGLDEVFVQAKRYTDRAVSREDVQAFVGALKGQRATKGVFITTSRFTANALDYVQKIDTKVVLIDGRRLVDLMIESDLGLSRARTYVVHQIDSDYFSEE